MYRISAPAPANPASGPFLEIRLNPAPVRILTGFGRIWWCISAELDQFLSEPLVSPQDDPASWWKMNMHRFPQLSPLAQKFLASLLSWKMQKKSNSHL